MCDHATPQYDDVCTRVVSRQVDNDIITHFSSLSSPLAASAGGDWRWHVEHTLHCSSKRGTTIIGFHYVTSHLTGFVSFYHLG